MYHDHLNSQRADTYSEKIAWVTVDEGETLQDLTLQTGLEELGVGLLENGSDFRLSNGSM